MADTLENWLQAATTGDGPSATEAVLQSIESQIGYRLPREIRTVLTFANRPEGFVGESYIAFFNPEDVIQGWREAQDSAPGFVPFASNGGGEWYGLDSRLDSPSFVLMPSIGMEWAEAVFLGTTWQELWETLQRGNLFDRDYHSSQKRSQPLP
jgi:hypothetical protein